MCDSEGWCGVVYDSEGGDVNVNGNVIVLCGVVVMHPNLRHSGHTHSVCVSDVWASCGERR